MVVVSPREFLNWYLIALKLNQTVVSGIQHAQSFANSRSIESPDEIQAQEQGTWINVQEEQQGEPLESDWVISIQKNLEQAHRATDSWTRLCIYRIPRCLRDAGDDKAYIPQIVSLGPYHHGEKGLRVMDHHKWRALHQILKRTNQRIELYLTAVKELEEKARACYEGSISLTSNQFVEMMVLDSCFILELFRGTAEGFTQLGYSRNDPVFAMRSTMHLIQRDMIMLENQIPLFVLERLLNLQSGNQLQHRVARLALRFFDPLTPTDEPLTKRNRSKLESSMGHAHTFDPLTEQGGFHCLEVFRRNLLVIRTGPKPTPRFWRTRWSNTRRVADKRRQQFIHRVTDLKNSGIRFRKRKTDRFWDIKFKNGILHIPRLLIHDGTKSLFLNLIAYEQCHLDCTNDITSYVIFMDNLIDSPEDVSYLRYYGIIEHWLGNDAEVAELFHRLCQEVVFDRNESYLSGLSEQVNRYYDHRWNKWRASLKHTYFNTPWSIISFFAAVLLLAWTLTQTFYSVYGYYKPHH